MRTLILLTLLAGIAFAAFPQHHGMRGKGKGMNKERKEKFMKKWEEGKMCDSNGKSYTSRCEFAEARCSDDTIKFRPSPRYCKNNGGGKPGKRGKGKGKGKGKHGRRPSKKPMPEGVAEKMEDWMKKIGTGIKEWGKKLGKKHGGKLNKLGETIKKKMGKHIATMMKKGQAERKRLQQKMTRICGSDGNTYNKTKCDGGVQFACNNITFVHIGECGSCSEDNVCPLKAMLPKFMEKMQLAEKLGKSRLMKMLGHKLKKIEERLSKEICATDGQKYTLCDFYMARCRGEDLQWEECEDETDMGGEEEEEEEEDEEEEDENEEEVDEDEDEDEEEVLDV